MVISISRQFQTVEQDRTVSTVVRIEANHELEETFTYFIKSVSVLNRFMWSQGGGGRLGVQWTVRVEAGGWGLGGSVDS